MTAADVLLPMLAVDDDTFFIVEIDKRAVRVPVANFARASFFLRDQGRSVGLVPVNGKGSTGRQGVLWVECASRAHTALLRRLPVPPSVILRDGVRAACTALWWLSEPLSAKMMPGVGRSYGEEANRRLAHALGAPKKWCDAGHRVRALSVEHAVPVRHSAKAVVGSLGAAPVAAKWAA